MVGKVIIQWGEMYEVVDYSAGIKCPNVATTTRVVECDVVIGPTSAFAPKAEVEFFRGVARIAEERQLV